MDHKRALYVLLWLSPLLFACSLLLPEPTATPAPTATYTPVPPTETPVPPGTAAAPPTATPPPASSTIRLTPTLVAVTPLPPAEGYLIEDERTIGAYTIRLWRNPSNEMGFDRVVILSRPGQPEARVEFVAEVGAETGTDLTGEGNPDVVIRVYTGGAHCCFSTIVYDLGPALTRVLETPLSNCDGSFRDLDGDGVFEYVTCDDLFAYVYCPFAGSPAVQVILAYEPGRGYQPASPRYAEAYAEVIESHAAQARATQPGELGEWDATNKCGVLPLVLDYLYTGQEALAWAVFQELYDGPDAELFWAEVRQAASDSPLYTPDGQPVDAPLPAYYMLQLYTNCLVDQMQGIVGVLREGQAGCIPNVPRRDIYWLQTQLQRGGILREGEMLLLAPEGCEDACRLDVSRIADGALVATIRLDTEDGFPGAVERIEGETSERWRLRGDLTWERVAP